MENVVACDVGGLSCLVGSLFGLRVVAALERGSPLQKSSERYDPGIVIVPAK
jgi:hypothetical protein